MRGRLGRWPGSPVVARIVALHQPSPALKNIIVQNSFQMEIKWTRQKWRHHLAGKEAETRSWSRQGTDRRPANFFSKKKRKKGNDLLHAAHPLHRGGRLLWPAAPDQVDLALGLLLLHPVEEGEEQVRVRRRHRPLRPPMFKCCTSLLSSDLRNIFFSGLKLGKIVPSEKNIHNQTWGHVWRGAEHEIRWNFTSARGGTWSAHSPDAPCKYALIDQDQVWSYQNEHTDLVHILFMVSCYWTLSTYILLIFCSTCANAIVTNQWFHQLA